MNRTTHAGRRPPAPTGRGRWWGRAVAALAVVCLSVAVQAADTKPAKPVTESDLSDETRACLKCHDDPAIAPKALGDGGTLSMQVSMKAYLASMHAVNDCSDCHSDLDDKTHGKVKTPLASRREMTASMQDSCRDCHKKKVKQYDDGIHALLAKQGDPKAPLCADCHNAHTQPSVKLVAPIEQTPCKSCHDKIFDAYKADVHGLERVLQGKKAPICADCHRAHDIQAASFDKAPRESCLGCHDNALAEHEKWLPNAGLHFESISCPACHVPDAKRRVNLRLFDAADRTLLREKTGVPRFVNRAQEGDSSSLGLDERALWSLLTQFNQDEGASGQVVLRGRLEVRSGIDAHRMAPKEKALKDCKACHAQGAEPFQSVVLSVAGPDGRPLRHGVQKDVLASLTALEPVRGFYAIGSTRIKLLDVLLALVVAGSIGGCLAHMTLRRLTAGARQRRAAAEAAAAARSGHDTK